MSAIIVSISKKQVSKQKASTILLRKLTSFISVILEYTQSVIECKWTQSLHILLNICVILL